MKILPKSKFRILDRGQYYEVVEIAANRSENPIQKSDRVARKLGMDEGIPYFAGFSHKNAFRSDQNESQRQDWDIVLDPCRHRDREIEKLKRDRAAQIASNSKIRKNP